MRTILREPVPRSAPLRFNPPEFPTLGITPLQSLDLEHCFPIEETIMRRRSARSFGEISLTQLSRFLWSVSKTKEIRPRGIGGSWERRSFPSAGGCHAIEILVARPTGQAPEFARYEPISHSLSTLPESELVRQLRSDVAKVLDPQQGTVLMFAGDTEKVGSHYEHGESLLWRDAGVLLGGASIVAEALELSFCPLGLTGQRSIPGIFPGEDRFMGLGGLVVGSRAK